MSDHDDDRDGDDDPLMRSMRAVWLTMRDEQPPEKGLSALLIAAREKADAMRPKESRWQRMFAALRRPPVLALATVVVLLGGAVALTVRGTAMKDGAAPQSAPGNVHDDEQVELRTRLTHTQPDDQPPGAPASEPARTPVRTPAPPVAQHAVPRPPQGPVAPGRAPTMAPLPDDEIGGDHGEAAAPVPPRPERSEKPPEKRPESKESGLAIATDGRTTTAGGAETTTARPPPPPPPRPRAAPAAEPASDAELEDRGARTAQTTQLVQQCETAAARGDCAAARVMAEKIRKLDANVYRARVKSNATIARCLN